MFTLQWGKCLPRGTKTLELASLGYILIPGKDYPQVHMHTADTTHSEHLEVHCERRGTLPCLWFYFELFSCIRQLIADRFGHVWDPSCHQLFSPLSCSHTNKSNPLKYLPPRADVRALSFPCYSLPPQQPGGWPTPPWPDPGRHPPFFPPLKGIVPSTWMDCTNSSGHG